jgi:hypothetical protein
VCVSKKDFEKAFEARSTRSLFMAQKESLASRALFKSCQEESGYNREADKSLRHCRMQ